MNNFTRLLAICFLLIGLTGCEQGRERDKSNSATGSLKRVAVTNEPSRFFAETIGGEGIEVQFPIPNDVDPRTWNPTPEAIQQLQQADLIFINGAGYSKWLPTVSLPLSKVVDTSAGFEDALLELGDTFAHRHGPKGGRSDREFAWAVWMDLALAKKQAQAIADALIAAYPDEEPRFLENLKSLFVELENLDKEYQQVALGLKDIHLATTSPCYQYLARKYKLSITSLKLPVDGNATAKLDEEVLGKIRKNLEGTGVTWMIWPDQPAKVLREQLENTLNLKSLVLLPADRVDGQSNWLKTMQQNLDSLRQITKNQ